jgi:hypothetical protein
MVEFVEITARFAVSLTFFYAEGKRVVNTVSIRGGFCSELDGGWVRVSGAISGSAVLREYRATV